MKKSLLLIAFACFSILGCKNSEVALTSPAALYQNWTHAREEQGDANSSIMIFRLSDSQDFATSRYRAQYEFSANGECSYLYLHQADAHEMRNARYEFDQVKDVLTIFYDEEDREESFNVLELTQDKLVIERID